MVRSRALLSVVLTSLAGAGLAAGCGDANLIEIPPDGGGDTVDATTTGPDGAAPPSDRRPDSPPDDRPPPTPPPPPVDAGLRSPDASIACGASGQTCGGGQVCCVALDGGTTPSFSCKDSCGSAPSIGCDGPEDCAGSVCCAKISVGAGSAPACPIEKAQSSCETTCTSSIPRGCPGNATLHSCRTKSDCTTEPRFNQCCRFATPLGPVSVCADLLLAFAADECE
jgi:hypothetical protein